MYKSLYLLSLVFLIIAQSCTTELKDKELTIMPSPAGENSEEPNLINGADGNLYLSWIERGDELATLKYAKWVEDKWSATKIIASGNDWFVNWADYPAMSVNKSGDMIAHYLQKSDSGTYTYDVKVVSKRKNSNAWSSAITLHSDSVNAEHGFVSMLPLDNENFMLTWLDGRNTASEPNEQGHSNGAMTIRAATLNPDLEIIEENELDNRVCDCCQTSTALTSNGPVVVYRDRSENEIRDMSIARNVDGEWSSPQIIYPDDWNIAGCPVNGPRIVAIENQVAVAWFSAPDGDAQVKIAFSNDGGESFGDPIKLDQGNALGRVSVVLTDKETAFVSWLEGESIVAAQVGVNGKILGRKNIASTSESRGSGFPQIALIGGDIMIAWTDVESKSIKTGILVF